MTRHSLAGALALAALATTTGCPGGGGHHGSSAAAGIDDRGDVTLDTSQVYFNQQVQESADLTLNFDANTVGALVYAQADPPGDRTQYVFTSMLTAPDGTALVQAGPGYGDLHPYQTLGPPVRPEIFIGSSSFELPESDEGTLQRGTYKFRIAAIGMQAHVWVVRRTGSQPSGGTLDLNLFFVEGCGYTSMDTSSIQGALDGMGNVLGEANLSLGKINAYDITGADAQQYVTLSVDDLSTSMPVRQLLSLSSRGATGAYNIFFVKSIEETAMPGYVLQGVSMGIPAALDLPGTLSAGSIISIDGHRENGSAVNLGDMGLTMAHETSHSLGLFHTTEAQVGGGHDLIGDTPECPDSADTNGDGVLTPDECGGYDANNFMFWTGSGHVLTPGQGSVITRAVVVH